MLFNSAAFLFLFLPVAWALFLFLKQSGLGRAALYLVGIASLIFYAMWDFHYLALLIGSIIFNFYVGNMQIKHGGGHKGLMALGVAANLLCLGYFKYAAFFVENINFILPEALQIAVPHIILPLGISFFTFLQIAYLVDAYRGQAGKHSFIEYLSFVTFFPHLIAGPILNHKTIMPQFHALPHQPYDWHKMAMGLSLLAIGLFKKVVIADRLALYATPVFTAADQGNAITLADGWTGALAYTLQLYFDFSAYSDMAIGIGLMFGIRLPENFLSPYKATNIVDFWQRWHITLSSFLKNYLYIPLGGNRKGEARRYINLMLTMLLGGLWHGAGWTFVIWGGLHGAYLAINHAFRRFFPAIKIHAFIGWSITFLAVIIGWVFFRAESVSGALNILQAMAGLNETGALDTDAWSAIMISLIIVLVAPNAMQIISHAENAGVQKWYSWALNKRWAALTILALLISIYLIFYNMNRVSEFIYFQF